MRITHGMLSDTTLRNLNRTIERLDRLQDELTSGQRISKPSDDPIGAATAVEFRGTISEIEQYLRNVDAAKSWLEATDAALDAITGVLHRTRELAVQGANDSLSQIDRLAMANEVSSLVDQAIAQANATYAGQHLFSGTKVTSVPFSRSGGSPTTVIYNGDDTQIKRQIDNQTTIIVNVVGSAGLNRVFSALNTLRGALDSGGSQAISATITDIDQALDAVLSTRAEVGARVNRLNGQEDRLASLKTNFAGLLSKVQDVDMTEAISDYATQQNVYEAALAAGSRAIQPSLLDYLR